MPTAETAPLRRNPDLLCAPVGEGGAVMLSVATGLYFGLDPVGLRIWELLEAPRAIGELRDRLLEEFDVDAAACEADLKRFVDEMLDNGVVTADAA